ncbi:sodium/hydrogen exchanger 1-like [Rosa rugosa]|uniref:sodium/hydrogen exchanger 1-like n=1 Tax=Rosa rugosa TaxID=74645 RepID=UPI002B409426|nr:sodium/hydrogen exchanger 1-like [Rosa rugosa]
MGYDVYKDVSASSDKRNSQELSGDAFGEEFKGYVFKIMGGCVTSEAVGAILSVTDSVCTLQVLSQDDTPFLYIVVFGEGVVNDATSIVLFNAVQSLDVSNVSGLTALKLLGTFLYLFFTSTLLCIAAGLISAYIIKTLYFGRYEGTLLEC